jgi:hypothetical protein
MLEDADGWGQACDEGDIGPSEPVCTARTERLDEPSLALCVKGVDRQG